MVKFFLENLCVNGITVDPQPDWSFDSLISELQAIDNRNSLVHFKTPPKKLSAAKKIGRNSGGFALSFSCDDDIDGGIEDEAGISVDKRRDSGSGSGSGSEGDIGRSFVFDEDEKSDDFSNGKALEALCLVGEGVAKIRVNEVARDHHTNATEEARSLVQSLADKLIDQNEKLVSSTTKINRRREMQQEIERKSDMQYKLTVAESLDNYLTATRRDFEEISQIEERKIREDAAHEEAKRKQKALEEERLRAEHEARLKAELADRAKAMAMKAEAEKRASVEAEAASAHTKESSSITNAVGTSNGNLHAQPETSIVRASKNALELEKRRRQLYEELVGNQTDNQEYASLEKAVARRIRSLTATNFGIKAADMVNTINSSGFPQNIGAKIIVDKILNTWTSEKSADATLFATSGVLVLVNSQVPATLDVFLAEMNHICMYTVPKQLSYSEQVFKTRDSYLKAIGYHETNGKLESKKQYIERLRNYMRLYGAIVQTEIAGVSNPHGLVEGWAWLARFLKFIRADLYSTVALAAFLRTAGYAMYKRFGNQFIKLLRAISNEFVKSLDAVGTSDSLEDEKASIKRYIEGKLYKEEPQGARLKLVQSYQLESSILEGQ